MNWESSSQFRDATKGNGGGGDVARTKRTKRTKEDERTISSPSAAARVPVSATCSIEVMFARLLRLLLSEGSAAMLAALDERVEALDENGEG
jgi:capsular polysaccharide biosynthesis protein